jgi:hypothetical protein
VRRLWDITLTAAITAVVTTLVNNAVADTSTLGRAWEWLHLGFLAFADRAAPVLSLATGVFLVLWVGIRFALARRQGPVDALEINPLLPNPLTVLAWSGVLLLAAALSLERAASGSDVAAVAACCVGVVALRGVLRLIADVRRTIFGTPF